MSPMSESRPSYLIGRAARISRSRLEGILADVDISLPELTALSVLASKPGLSNARLARRSLVTPQAMHKVMTSLEHRGLVTRTAAGGRTLGADITVEGLAVLRKAEPLMRAAETEFLGRLEHDERDQFVRLLTKVCGLESDD